MLLLQEYYQQMVQYRRPTSHVPIDSDHQYYQRPFIYIFFFFIMYCIVLYCIALYLYINEQIKRTKQNENGIVLDQIIRKN
jgi:hypothetical protein